VAVLVLGLERRVDAYIDPGTMVSTLTGVLASAGALFVLAAGVIAYPVRRAIQLMRRKRG